LKNGVLELCLIAQDTASYGTDTDGLCLPACLPACLPESSRLGRFCQ
jgi:tRNA A37 methylthiotransferase MiaB